MVEDSSNKDSQTPDSGASKKSEEDSAFQIIPCKGGRQSIVDTQPPPQPPPDNLSQPPKDKPEKD